MTMNPENITPPIDPPLWRLKYRPLTLEKLVSSDPNLIQQLSGYIKTQNFPHLLLVGPTGSGKTTIAEVLAREVLKTEFDMNYQLLFAGDPISKQEREDAKRESYVSTKRIGSSAGTQRTVRPFIQMRVKPFVATQKYGSSPFKILCIKDFHQLDVEQQAFRRIMEQYTSNCRMILISDRISGIIDPIISRCQVILVPYLNERLFLKSIKNCLDQEKIAIKLDAVSYVQYISNSNVGKALDLLQMTYQKFGDVELKNISTIAKLISGDAFEILFNKAVNGNFKDIRKALRDIFNNNNLSKAEILLGMCQLVTQKPLERNVRALLLDLIAQADFDSLDSSDDEIQLDALLSKIALIGKEI